MKTSVQNITNNKVNKVANQFEITTAEGRYFQSYKSIIVFIPNNNDPIQLGKDWRYSKTTSIHRNNFLGETTKETERKLKEGIYILNENL